MEQAVISGIAHDTSEMKITLRGLPDEVGMAAQLFSILAGNNVSVDMIIQNTTNDGKANISFTFPGSQKEQALEAVDTLVKKFGRYRFDGRKHCQGFPGGYGHEIRSWRCR